ncbi:CLUMA_CG019799, isoform A [Clunio marinus]|uniref:CLUMA_CG019799, isoform A n=1 Tax=Clunio marinus TaxID=568069 RepID=A0A1J1J2S4_9DIPT|nr:CLUMA_CG019799, isoform A [Clunio marinus]
MISYSELHKFGCDVIGHKLIIWNHHKKNPPAVQNAIKKLTSQKFFVISYWLNIVFAVIGIGEALKELYRILSTPNYQSKIFGSREINCVSLKNQRLLRIVGLLSNIALLLMTCVGLNSYKKSLTPKLSRGFISVMK